MLRISRRQQQSVPWSGGPVWLHRSHRREACPGDGLRRPPPRCVRRSQGPPCPHLPRPSCCRWLSSAEWLSPPWLLLPPVLCSPCALYIQFSVFIPLVQEIFIRHLLCTRHWGYTEWHFSLVHFLMHWFFLLSFSSGWLTTLHVRPQKVVPAPGGDSLKAASDRSHKHIAEKVKAATSLLV